MKRYVVTVTVLLAAAAGIAFGAGGLAAADPSEAGAAPHPRTIVEVTGDKWNGFEIYRYDGSAEFPPTNSEARAECGEYDTRVERVRCRTEVRVRYRMLGELRRSIDYQRSLRE